MPTIIADIDALLPDDPAIKWRGREWILPGDLDVERIFRLERGLQKLGEAGQSKDVETAKATFEQLGATVVEILAIKQPEATEGLTLGVQAVGILAGAILAAATGRALPTSKPENGQGNNEGNGERAASQ